MHVASVALASLLVAAAVNVLVETMVASLPPMRANAAHRQGTAPDSAALDLAQLARVTGLRLPSDSSGPEPDSDSSARPSRTALRLRLLGTLLSTDAAWSIASVLDLAHQKASTVMVGDQIQGARVLDILRDRVIIANDGRREFIDSELGGLAPGPSPDARTRGLADLAGQRSGTGIRQLAENQYEVPRSEIEETLRHLDRLSGDAHIVLAYKDGKPEGFKLFSIRPGSLYSSIGIVNGDVIKRINGFEMNAAENALEAYTRLRDANRIDIDIDRDGTTVRKTYSIR